MPEIEVHVDVEKCIDMFRYVDSQWRQTLWDIKIEIANRLAERAKRRAPIRTGRLRRSIYAQVSGKDVVKLFAGAPYASFVEYGTRYMRPRSFLRPTISEAEREIEKLAREIIEDLFDEAEGRY